MRLSLLVLFFLAAPAFADVVTLKTGDRLVGTIVQENDEALFLEHPMFGTLKIAKAQIAPPPEVAPAQTEAQATAAAVKEAPKAEPAPPAEPKRNKLMQVLHDNNFKLEAGFNGSDGNSRSLNARIGATANRETDDRRWKFDASYNRNSSRGLTTRNEATTGLTHDWLVPDSPWFYYGRGRADWDQFEDWDYRLNAAGGVGYEFINTDTLRLLGRAGLGGYKEFGSQDDELHPEAEVGGELKWKITDAQTFEASHLYFRALDEGQFRMRTTMQWVMKLDHADGISLKLGMVNEYDSEPGANKKENDLKYYGAMVFDF